MHVEKKVLFLVTVSMQICLGSATYVYIYKILLEHHMIIMMCAMYTVILTSVTHVAIAGWHVPKTMQDRSNIMLIITK